VSKQKPRKAKRNEKGGKENLSEKGEEEKQKMLKQMK
jgi:hypothetical protein